MPEYDCECKTPEQGTKLVPCDGCMDKMHGYTPRKIARPSIEINEVYTVHDGQVMEYEADKIIRDINNHFRTVPEGNWSKYKIILKRIC